MENTKRISMRFKSGDEKSYGITVKNAKDDVKDEDIKKLMDSIVEKKVIKVENSHLAKIKGASFIETNKKDFNLV